jgi:hypothetical protein
MSCEGRAGNFGLSGAASQPGPVSGTYWLAGGLSIALLVADLAIRWHQRGLGMGLMARRTLTGYEEKVAVIGSLACS